ncbi:MAG: hypothetical protein KGY80_10325 [Candidatus Thorarchaeota archaeon]|nr:hypothetical protein [Candidatus Thorarchaeota archaeon]
MKNSEIGIMDIQSAIIDYLLISVTNNERNYNSLFSKEGFEKALKLLLEDIELEVSPNRGIALLSGVECEDPIYEFSENIRLRRATRFEIRSISTSPLKPLHISQRIAEPFHFGKVQHGYFLEYHSDEPFMIDDDEITFMTDFLNNFKKRYDLDVSFDMPQDCKDGFSTNEADGFLHDFLSAVRLVWRFDIGLYWILYRSKRQSNPNSTYHSRKYGSVKPEFLTPRSHKPRTKQIGTIHLPRIRSFWNSLRLFRKNIDIITEKYFNKALMRFNRSFLVRDSEDAIMDLAIGFEILTSGAKGMTSYILAPFVSYEGDLQDVEEEISSFIGVRNRIVHGSVQSVEKKDLDRWVSIGQKIVAASLRNFVFYSEKIGASEKPKGKRGIRNTLKSCAISLTRRKWLRKKVAAWSMIEGDNNH